MDKQRAMDDLRRSIATQAEMVKTICRRQSLPIDRVTIIYRKHDQPQMQGIVSDDERLSAVVWWSVGEHLPNTDGWVLANIHPAKHGDVQDRDYLALASRDVDGIWRTQYGALHSGYKVTYWAEIPEPRFETE